MCNRADQTGRGCRLCFHGEEACIRRKDPAGDKVYSVAMISILAFFHIGQEPLEKGMNILGAHIDSPRIDIKQNPLYEEADMAYLDTHYYGGVKKYQWVALPLAIHGVIAKKRRYSCKRDSGRR